MTYPFWVNLSPYIRVYHRLAPFWLPGMPSINDFREWYYEILSPVPYPPLNLPSSHILRASLHRLLVETGIAMTPAISAFDSRAWFALYRYGDSFSGTSPHLLFAQHEKDIDPRLKALAAEEIAAGVACYLLREYFDVVHIADVYACIQNGELNPLPTGSPRRGDYFCETSRQQVVLAECKGSVGTRHKIMKALNKGGLSQLQHLQPTNLPLTATCSRVVLGTCFPIEGFNIRSKATTLIEDPNGLESNNQDPMSDTSIRLAYAKCFRFMGHDILADRLMTRRPCPEVDEMSSRELKETIFTPLAVSPSGDAIGFDRDILRALFNTDQTGVRKNIVDSLDGFRRRRERFHEQGYALSNGVIVLQDWEDLRELFE